jgi:hypothetical protein
LSIDDENDSVEEARAIAQRKKEVMEPESGTREESRLEDAEAAIGEDESDQSEELEEGMDDTVPTEPD